MPLSTTTTRLYPSAVFATGYTLQRGPSSYEFIAINKNEAGSSVNVHASLADVLSSPSDPDSTFAWLSNLGPTADFNGNCAIRFDALNLSTVGGISGITLNFDKLDRIDSSVGFSFTAFAYDTSLGYYVGIGGGSGTLSAGVAELHVARSGPYAGMKSTYTNLVIEFTWYRNNSSATASTARYRIYAANVDVTYYAKDAAKTDTGTGSDVATLGRLETETDAGSGIDSGTVRASNVAADSGAGSDAASVVIGISVTDTGFGSDAPELETADAKDTTALDFGTAAGAYVTTADALGAETGVGVESFTLDIIESRIANEYGFGHDACCVDAVAPPIAETGAGADDSTVGVTVSITGSGAMTGTVAATLTAAATGSGADAGVVGQLAAETGAGTDTPAAEAGGAPAETGSGVDTAVAAADVVAAETGAGVFSAVADAAVAVTEIGVELVSAAAVFVGFDAAYIDSGAGIDAGAASNAAIRAELGIGTDAGAVTGNAVAAESGLLATESAAAAGNQFAADAGSGVELLDATADGVHIRFAFDDGTGVDAAHWCIAGEDVNSSADIVAEDLGAGTDAGLTDAVLAAAETGSGADDPTAVETQSPYQTAADVALGADDVVIGLVCNDAGSGADAGSSGYKPSGGELQLYSQPTMQLTDGNSVLQLYSAREPALAQ